MAPGRDDARRNETRGLAYGLLGVAVFSMTLPATRIAVAEIHPLIAALGRCIVAAVIAAAVLAATRAPRPRREDLPGFAIVIGGVVLGFPIFTNVAMKYVPAAHGAIVLAILPLATAIAGTLRAGDRPSAGFWLAALAGSALVIAFALWQGAGSLHIADFALLAAVITCGFGYAEGARLARHLGGWQVISWALVLSAPVLALPVAWLVAQHGLDASPRAWLGFLYVALISQFVGFFPWYKGLALGGVARVGQVQLLQPFLTLVGSALLLGEALDAPTLAFAVAVVATVAVGRRMPVRRTGQGVQPDR
jgi:drug/metabolite transporter (DMT)-like permease